MSKVGLAWDLDVTSEVRINAKKLEAAKQSLRSEWQAVNDMYESFRQRVYTQIAEIDQKSIELKHNIKQSLDELKIKIDGVIEDIKIFIDSPESSSRKLLKMSRDNFAKLQQSLDVILRAA
jgi:hypothetical protein